MDKLQFGPLAWAPLEPQGASGDADAAARVPPAPRASETRAMLAAAVPGVERWRGQRGQVAVTDMVQRLAESGCFMFGGARSSVNREVVPAARRVLAEAARRPEGDLWRGAALRTLAEACLDCQQVQAREVLRLYAALTSQTASLERQVQHLFLLRKRLALDVLITRLHADTCDLDYTRARPWQQRAHLASAYTVLLCDHVGLDRCQATAAAADRFLDRALEEVTAATGGAAPEELARMLREELDAGEAVDAALADCNNQTAGADRHLTRDCVFAWARDRMPDDPHAVFWDESRADEYRGQAPDRPLPENQYDPFLSRGTLVRMLRDMEFLAA